MVTAEMACDYGEELFAVGGRTKLVQGIGGSLLVRVEFPVRRIFVISTISIVAGLGLIVR